MKKVPVLSLMIIVTAFFSTQNVSGQGKKPGLLLGGNVVYNKPSSTFGTQYNKGAGAEIMGGIGLGKTYVVASTGYTRFFGNSDNSDLIYKPIKVGLRQYLLGKHLFVNADIGKASVKNVSKATTGSHLVRGVGAGARLFGLEASVNYEGWSKSQGEGFNNSLQYKVGFNIML